jgi:biopolymer transport protein ExbD
MQFVHRSRRKRANINITSLIDILFLLIIFFVVTSTFLEQSGMRLDLPSVENIEPTEVRELVLSMDAEGNIRLGSVPVTLGGLRQALERRVEKAGVGAGRVLVIRADKGAQHGDVVRVMDIAKQAGVRDLVIAADAAPADDGAP